MISHDDDRENDDLSGEWPRRETLDLEPAPPPDDWLREFAAERSEPARERVPPVEPRPRSLFRIQPVPEPAIEPAQPPPSRAPVRPIQKGRHSRLPLMLLAAGIVFVALVEVPGLQHRPWLLVPPADFSAPPALVEAVRNDERAVPPPALQAREEPRQEPSPRMQPQPPQRRDVSVPVLAASLRPATPTRATSTPAPSTEPAPLTAAAPPPSPPPAVTPAVLSVRSATSLDSLLGRTVTSAALPAPPAAPAPPPPLASAGGPPSEAEARRASRVAAVESVVDRYRRAFNTLDARAVKAFWPGVDVRALERAFDRLVVQRFEFDRCQIELAGPRAFATCDGRARAVRKFGDKNPPAQAREWMFTLGEANETWVILSVNARPMQ